MLILLLVVCFVSAQTLTISGTVTSAGKPQSDALIDVYEYNSVIQALHSDDRGRFSFEIMKGKEYVVVVYKSGYLLQSFSLADSRLSTIKDYAMAVDLSIDGSSPSGLYFKDPVKRIAPDIGLKNLLESRFDLGQIRPQPRADSVLVLLNRAQANQYILVSKMKLSMVKMDDKYSRQIEENVKAEMNSYAAQINQSNARYDALKQEEDAHVAASFQTKADEQYDHILMAQKKLAERLAERSNYFLLLQQKQLAKARLLELDAIKYDQMIRAATDSANREDLRKSYWKLKAQATNARYLAMDANAKFLSYNKYQMLNYQEYIEMLRYKDSRRDTSKAPAVAVKAPEKVANATMSASDTSDNLSKLDNASREKLIQEALEEEERFKNYESKTSVRKINGTEQTVQNIRIADDNYEMQVDKKGSAKHYKNGKPVTRLTFEFETRRRMVDVLNTIREVEKFGR